MSAPTILIVDDSPTQVNHLATLLEKYPIHIETAASGVQCLRYLEERNADGIVLDVNMPGMDGLQITRRIRRNPKTAEMPIILLSASSNPENIQEGYRSGATSYINKGPFAEQYLISTFQRLGIID